MLLPLIKTILGLFKINKFHQIFCFSIIRIPIHMQVRGYVRNKIAHPKNQRRNSRIPPTSTKSSVAQIYQVEFKFSQKGIPPQEQEFHLRLVNLNYLQSRIKFPRKRRISHSEKNQPENSIRKKSANNLH